MKKFFLVLACVVLGAGVFAAGVWMGYAHPEQIGLTDSRNNRTVKTLTKNTASGLASLETTYEEIDFAPFWQVWELAARQHLEEEDLQTADLIYGAINGMLQFGFKDQFSSFLPPDVNEIASDDLKGKFSGVGIELEMQEGDLTIVAPLSDTPAAKAGLLAGDVIRTVDGDSIEDLTVLEAVELIRGSIGTTVTLGITRITDDRKVSEFDVEVTRDIIDVESVKWEDRGDGMYSIKVRNFAADTMSEWDRAVDAISAARPRGIILDLRNNAGGYVTGAVHFISEFVPSGVAVRQDFGAGEVKNLYVYGDGKLVGVPVVVLVNRGTASASEMVAGALQDYGVAKLIGERTFGKGVLQEIFDLEIPGEAQSASVRIVTARWYTPKERTVEFVGLQPDIEVKTTIEQYEREEDPVLERAMEEVR
ncbi:MAG TPA: S41 family peptidase [bacterium]|nr:S41 family peptidase [bacterium]